MTKIPEEEPTPKRQRVQSYHCQQYTHYQMKKINGPVLFVTRIIITLLVRRTKDEKNVLELRRNSSSVLQTLPVKESVV